VPQPAPRPQVKLDRIVSAPAASLQGQLLRRDNAPNSRAKLMFVSLAKNGPQQTVTTDASGRFQLTLSNGSWLVYEYGADNRPQFHSKIELRENEAHRLTFVSR